MSIAPFARNAIEVSLTLISEMIGASSGYSDWGTYSFAWLAAASYGVERKRLATSRP